MKPDRIRNLILRHIMENYPDFHEIPLPRWIKKARWRPTFIFRGRQNRLIAVDMILSGTLPKFIYTKIVRTLQSEHPRMRVIIFTIEEKYSSGEEIENYCRENNIGLKAITAIGIQTVVRNDYEPVPAKLTLPRDDGWFPNAIINAAMGLSHLSFRNIIERFIEDLPNKGTDEEQIKEIVCNCIDELLKSHPSFSKGAGKFMKLNNFERILKLSSPDASDHVIHSFRIFLAGCPIIDKFYDHFLRAHGRYGNPKVNSVEYSWLLAAVFHDIGRIKQLAGEFAQAQIDDDEIAVHLEVMPSKWQSNSSLTTMRILGSFGAFIAQGDTSAIWDAGTLGGQDKEAKSLTDGWIGLYGGFSHSVVSALDFFSTICSNAAASDMRKYRAFLVGNAVPASLAILLHDWHIWKSARKWGLFPIDVEMLPLAALLVYLDTWDDYKRRGNDQLIHLEKYDINDSGAVAGILWGDSQLLENEKRKYASLSRAFKNRPFQLKVVAKMVGEK